MRGPEEPRGGEAEGAGAYLGTAGSSLQEAGLASDRTEADSDAPGTVHCRSVDGQTDGAKSG